MTTKKRTQEADQVRRAYEQHLLFTFGGLAIVAACAALDPLALRPRLSPGLPFRLSSTPPLYTRSCVLELSFLKFRPVWGSPCKNVGWRGDGGADLDQVVHTN